MNVTAYVPGGFSGPVARQSLRDLAETRTTHVVLVPTWYMTTASASEVRPEPAKTPSDAGLLAAAREARALGMAVAVKPHVDVLDGTFRGDIAPDDVDAWFTSYERFAVRYARLARAAGAETFVVGTELVTMAQRDRRFRDVIAAVRRVFDGELTYAANWVQDAEDVGFWDALDAIGIDAYMPLTEGRRATAPSVAELVDAWRPFVDRVTALRSRFGDLPVRFTELGYPSRLGATSFPARVDPDAPVDARTQAVAYAAAFEAWRGIPWFHGIWWWDWSLDGRNAGRADGSYRPAGTRAEQILRRYAGTTPVAGGS